MLEIAFHCARVAIHIHMGMYCNVTVRYSGMVWQTKRICHRRISGKKPIRPPGFLFGHQLFDMVLRKIF
jgi:hypothetical protein